MKIQRNSAILERVSGELHGIQIACEHSPDFGVPMLVTSGIWWVRLPVASSLQAVNVYLLEDGKGLTLVDTGVRSAECREALNAALAHPDLQSRTLTRIIATHFHPDHIGLAGEFAQNGVELWTSRTTWLNCHVLSSNKQLLPLPSEVTFMQRAGLTGIELEAFRRRAVNRYNASVAPPPDHYVPLVDGQSVTIGQRSWRVVMSYGHAAEHLSLWSDDYVISGDQILPSISSNLTVPYTESDVDLIGEWLRSCRDLTKLANNVALCLPGHQRPFYGIRNRLLQVDENIRRTLSRLETIASLPVAAFECVEQVYGRSLSNDERRLLLPEVVGMLNHLYFHERLDRTIDSEGVHRYVASTANASKLGRKKKVKGSQGEENAMESEPGIHHLASSHAIPLDDLSDDESSSETGSGLNIGNSYFRSRFSRLMVLSTLCLIGGIAYWKWDRLSSSVNQLLQASFSTDFQTALRTPAQAAIVPVETIQVIEQSHAEIPREFTGVVKPRRASQIGFNRVGVIEEIMVERGDRVEADTILATLNTNLLKANLKAVQAQYRAAEAKLSELVAGPRAQTIESARAQVASAKAESELAETLFNRSQRLIGVGAVSVQDVDNAKTNLAAKEEALKAAQSTLDELLEGTRSEQVLAQRAQLAELEAAQEEIQVQLDESVLRAPFPGEVSDRFVEPGAVTSPGSVAFRLIDAQSPEVWVGMPPDFVSTIRNMKDLQVTIGEQVYPVIVKSILPELDEATRTNTVILELQGEHRDKAVFGQVARVDLARKFEHPGFWVPLAALTQGDQGLWALLSLEPIEGSENFILKRLEVEVMQVGSDQAFVRGTIESGTHLVSTGVRRLTPGQQVKLKTGPETTPGQVALSEKSSHGDAK